MTFPSESIAFIFSTRRMRVSSFLASEYQTTNSFLWLNDRRVQLFSELRAWRPPQLDGNLDVPLFGIRRKDNRHSVSSLYARMAAGGRIDNEVLNPAPVPDCAAPRVAIYRHLHRNFSFAPDLSCVEGQRERCSPVVARLISV
jgi:hypothetical protein